MSLMKDQFPNGAFCLVLLSQAELTFCAGDIIAVFGEIDEDGFYYVRMVIGCLKGIDH